jgi:selenium-binding protein 1
VIFLSKANKPHDADAHAHNDHGVDGPGYASPQAAIEEADRETAVTFNPSRVHL